MNRLEWILGITLVVLLLAVGILSLVFWFGDGTATVGRPSNTATVIAQRAAVAAPTSTFTGYTARLAYAKAQQTAVAWQPDAQLLNASATWPQSADADSFRQGEITWGFTFYSPAAGELAAVSVVGDQVQVVSQKAHRQENPVAEATSWEIDSHEAIRRFLNNGGDQFLSTEGVTTLTMLLNADDEDGDGRMQWQVSLVSLPNGRALTMRLDATSGEILENKTVP